MSGVRSRSLAHGTTSDASIQLVYTVPSGKSTIVKSLVVFSRAAAAQNIDLAYRLQAGGLDLPLVFDSVPANGWKQYSLWDVLEQTDQLWFSGGGAGISWAISGSELPNAL